jgi:hypothetical protein
MHKYLYKRDNKSKVRVVTLILTNYNLQDGEFYTITGEGGLLGGKQVKRPTVTIDRGKVKRSIKEQAELEYDSLIKSYLDKGYKTSEQLNINDVNNIKEVNEKVPMENLDQNGAKKPMLAKNYRDVANFD